MSSRALSTGPVPWILVLVLLGAPPATAREEGEGDPPCRKCKTTDGRPVDRPAIPEPEAWRCSVAVTRLPPGYGIGWAPCPECAPEEAIEEWKALRRADGEWLEERRERVDQVLDADPDAPRPPRFAQPSPPTRPSRSRGETRVVEDPLAPGRLDGRIIHILTPHFRLATTLQSASVAPLELPEEGLPAELRQQRRKLTLDPHLRAHVWALRLEAARAVFLEAFDPEMVLRPVFGTPPGVNYAQDTERYDLFLWEEERDQRTAAHEFQGRTHPVVVRLNGTRLTCHKVAASRAGGGMKLSEDGRLHAYVHHHLQHLFLESAFKYSEKGLPPWVSEAFAHEMDRRVFGGPVLVCSSETMSRSGLAGGDWGPQAAALVARKQAPTFPDLTGKAYEELTQADHMYAWACVHLWLAEDPSPFSALVREAKRAESLDRAFLEVFNRTPLAMQEEMNRRILQTWGRRR